MNSICFIIPYFGPFPQYINAFLESCKDNSNYDFIIITDNQPIIAKNVKFINLTFQECQEIIKNKLQSIGFNKICINKPYKLCDYKPCFGYIFSEYLEGYKYWGHIDLDLIWGNISLFLSKIQIEKYDRIFRYGHLSIYRNTPNINMRFLEKNEWSDFEYSISTTLATHYDELGINYLYKKNNYPFYEENYSVTFATNEKSYKSGNPHYLNYAQLFVKYPNGGVYFYYRDSEGQINKEELIYVHFMSKKNVVIDVDLSKPYLLTPFGAITFDENKIRDYFDLYGNLQNSNLYRDKLKNCIKRIYSFIEELKYNKFNAFKFYYRHIKPSPFKYWN